MANVVVCPTCSRKLRLPDDLLGHEVRCPGCNKIFATVARPAKGSRRDDDEDEDRDEPDETDRPSRRGRSVRRNQLPHRGGLLLTLGIISLVTGILAVPVEFGLGLCTLCCVLGVFAMAAAGIVVLVGLGCGIPAIFLAQSDLRMMDEGTRDPSGRGTTRAGWICALIGVILNVLSILISLLLIAIFGTAMFTTAAATPPPQNQPPMNPPGRRFEIPSGIPRLQAGCQDIGATGSARPESPPTREDPTPGVPYPC
jgi:hypothetical protein